MNDSTYNKELYESNVRADQNCNENPEENNVKKCDESTKDVNQRNSQPEQDEQLWSIDDDTLFYPLGLQTHGHSASKCVFVTWSEDYLLNFVFKTSTKTKRTSLTKVRLAIEANDQVCDMLILELNTLLLMQSGRVYYFSSVKSIHPVTWLTGVRCMSAAVNGFSVIRVLSDNTIQLEVYRDVMNLGKSGSTLLHSFDITYNVENLFNCNWADEHYTLCSQWVQRENIKFMENVVRVKDALQEDQEVHLFAVSGQVYILIPVIEKDEQTELDTPPTTSDYHIQLLSMYASNVSLMRVLSSKQMCLIFLECGAIEIWYMSHTFETLRRQTHHTGSIYTHHEYSMANDCFYYTDAKQVTQLQFQYINALDEVEVVECYKAVPHILACTWSPNLGQLVCLSSNNIFYRLPFKQQNAIETEFKAQHENLLQLYELTPARVAQLMEKARLLDELQQAPQLLHNQIEAEFVKQQLIAVSHQTRLYSKQCQATLTYSMQLPLDGKENQTLIHTRTKLQLTASSYFALLELSVGMHRIYKTSIWQLLISYAGHMQLLRVPVDVLHTPLCIVLPLQRERHGLLSQFEVRLISCLNDDGEFLAVCIPIRVLSDANTFAALFRLSPRMFNVYGEQNINKLFAHFKAQQQSTKKECDHEETIETFKYVLFLPKASTFAQICQIFHEAGNTESDSFCVHFMDCNISIKYEKDKHSIELQCDDAAGIYYIKLFLFLKLQEWKSQQELQTVEDLQSDAILMVQQYQCEIERCYGTQLDTDDNNLNSQALHLEQLQRVHTKLRTEFNHNLLS